MIKKIYLVSIFVLFFSYVGRVLADNELPSKASDLSIGFNLNHFQNDFGLGLDLTSPYFLKDIFAVRASGNLQFLQGIPPGETSTSWMPYSTLKLGLVSTTGPITKSVRLYGEGGIVLLIPNSDFSDNLAFGGYGLFGFEFFVASPLRLPMSFFLEFGGMGTGAEAEKLAGQPIYSNGFTSSVGFREYF